MFIWCEVVIYRAFRFFITNWPFFLAFFIKCFISMQKKKYKKLHKSLFEFVYYSNHMKNKYKNLRMNILVDKIDMHLIYSVVIKCEFTQCLHLLALHILCFSHLWWYNWIGWMYSGYIGHGEQALILLDPSRIHNVKLRNRFSNIAYCIDDIMVHTLHTIHIISFYYRLNSLCC